MDFDNGLENGYHGSHVLPVPKKGGKKALKAHYSMLLPGCCLVMMRFGVLTTTLTRYDLRKLIVSNEVVSYQCLGTLEPKEANTVEQQNMGEFMQQMAFPSFCMWFLGDFQVQNVEFFESFEGQKLDEWHEEEGAGAWQFFLNCKGVTLQSFFENL